MFKMHVYRMSQNVAEVLSKLVELNPAVRKCLLL